MNKHTTIKIIISVILIAIGALLLVFSFSDYINSGTSDTLAAFVMGWALSTVGIDLIVLGVTKIIFSIKQNASRKIKRIAFGIGFILATFILWGIAQIFVGTRTIELTALRYFIGSMIANGIVLVILFTTIIIKHIVANKKKSNIQPNMNSERRETK